MTNTEGLLSDAEIEAREAASIARHNAWVEEENAKTDAWRLEQFHALQRQGFHVFPLDVLTPAEGGEKAATLDPDKPREWLAHNPDYNPAFVTDRFGGAPSNGVFEDEGDRLLALRINCAESQRDIDKTLRRAGLTTATCLWTTNNKQAVIFYRIPKGTDIGETMDWLSIADNVSVDHNDWHEGPGTVLNRRDDCAVMTGAVVAAPTKLLETVAAALAEEREVDEDEDDEPKPYRYEILSASDIKPKLDQVWLIDRVLPAGGVCVIDGQPSVGKTFNVIDMLGSVSRGAPWHGRRTEKSVVLYFAAEDNPDNRIAAYRKHHGVDLPDFHRIVDTVNLHHGTEDRRDLLLAAKDIGAQVIVIDTLAAAMTGGDENSSEGMGNVLAAARELRTATGATIILIHHQGKDPAKGARGHSSLEGALDTRISVANDVMTVQKQRNGEKGGRYGFALEQVELGRDIHGQMVTSCVAVPRVLKASDDFQPPKGQPGDAYIVLQDLCLSGEAASVEAWREEYLRKHHPVGSRATKSAAFTRAIKSLMASGHVIVESDIAKPVNTVNKASTF